MAQTPKSLNSTVTLNDGVEMPCFGLGLLGCKEGEESQAAVLNALKAGYRMVDTAEFFKNEADVGKAIAASGLDRKDIFIVTKLWDHGADTCKKHLQQQLERLQTSYVDLYLIHSPLGGRNVETYKAMLELKNEGKIRSVGVSNYGVHHLEGLKEAGMPAPSVNQVELHPYQRHEEIVKYCRDQGTVMMGYSPIAQAKRLSEPKLSEIAAKYNKTIPQIMIRWSIQHGYITIPKSAKPQHITENANVFDWSLSDHDMKQLNNFPSWSCARGLEKSPWQG